MTQAPSPETLPLFKDQDLAGDPHRVTHSAPPILLALNIDHREWLSFLAEEWWPVRPSDTLLNLGVVAPITSETISTDILAWIDPCELPDIPILILREHKWIKAKRSAIQPSDKQIAWPGPLPLFSVRRFSVSTEERKSHITAMANGFANIALSEQLVMVEQFQHVPASHPPKLEQILRPPELWNALRGAAAMATWSVPTIPSWLSMLCKMLNKPDRPSRPKKIADTDAPWLLDTPWRYLTYGPAQKTQERSVLLWRAILTVFALVKIREAWRPHEVLEQVCDEARRLGITPDSLDDLLHCTSAILDNKKVIDTALIPNDPMGFILQLILLRPKPEQFTTWRSTLPLLPPSILWTGAILSGLLNGYRNLDVKYRNNSIGRKLIDIQLWTLTTKKKISWPSSPPQKLALRIENNKALLLSNSLVWAEKNLGRRGRWYAADLDLPNIQKQAIEIANSHCPEALYQAIKIKNGRSAIQGSGRIKLETGKPRANRSLVVRGEFYLSFSDPASIVKRLDKDIFKHWISTATVDNNLPGPLAKIDPPPTSTALTSPNELSEFPVDGLKTVPDFISEEQERNLVSTINNAPWSNELKRRVQHYGWKYDYKSRGIQPSAYLGPLPDWAQALALRLVKEGLMPELADQVIVNEYVLQQGISRHIDCIDCFKGPVITISLLESWEMIFKKGSEKAEIMLTQRSATVLDGPARYEWTHEIPQRKREKDFLRSRRISITFRKVKVSDGS